ncbi:MAG: J domain-containing protein [Sphingomicrobium sp.]
MSSNPSAYRALGLEPGADGAAVDKAYKALIKRYHPDREGGDAARAAEINRAYFELRKPTSQIAEATKPKDLAEAIYARRSTRRRVVPQPRRRVRIWPIVVLLIAAILYLKREPLQYALSEYWGGFKDVLQPQSDDVQSGSVATLAAFDDPLESTAILTAVRHASALSASGADDRAVEESRACHRDLRAGPTMARFDGCAAFDNTVLEMRNSDPIHDDGVFSASAVTARQMASATLLSNDYVAIEGRLDRLRARVQVLLSSARDAGPTQPPKRDERPAQGAEPSADAHGRRR